MTPCTEHQAPVPAEILSAFVVPGRIGITERAFKTVLNAVGTILTAFGIVNNPTDPQGL